MLMMWRKKSKYQCLNRLLQQSKNGYGVQGGNVCTIAHLGNMPGMQATVSLTVAGLLKYKKIFQPFLLIIGQGKYHIFSTGQQMLYFALANLEPKYLFKLYHYSVHFNTIWILFDVHHVHSDSNRHKCKKRKGVKYTLECSQLCWFLENQHRT